MHLDALITPMLDLGLPLAGAFVRSRSVLLEMLELFQPTTLLASSTGGEVHISGVQARLLQSEGPAAKAAALVKNSNDFRSQLIDPVSGIAYELPVFSSD
jgi:hypothetical protein